MGQTQRKFTWQEMQEYWRIHSKQWSNIDYDQDPEGLTNVCFPGAPLWLNRYYACCQMRVYQKLFNVLPEGMSSKRVLEVGCGAGRWCLFLAERGWDTTGIDLQPELIDRNRVRYPRIKFDCISIQDYQADEPFDLISAVTVVQHIPFDEHQKVFRKFKQIIKPGGFLIMLDSIYYRTPHVFSRTVGEWQKWVEEEGFRCIATQRYDYTPFLRLQSCAQQKLWVNVLGHRTTNAADGSPESLVAARPIYPAGVPKRSFRAWLGNMILGDGLSTSFVKLDSMVEPVLIRGNFPLGARHCGFLFRASDRNQKLPG